MFSTICKVSLSSPDALAAVNDSESWPANVESVDNEVIVSGGVALSIAT